MSACRLSVKATFVGSGMKSPNHDPQMWIPVISPVSVHWKSSARM